MSFSKKIHLIVGYVHNKINREHFVQSLGVRIGASCRFGRDIMWGSEPYLISIGDHVTITNNVQFVTHDGGVWVARDRYPELNVFGPIKIGNNTFIGIRSIIMPGVTIGNDCVIGAGSVVTRDIPDGSIAAGVPAKVLCSTDDYIEKMLSHPGRLDSKELSYSHQKEALMTRYSKEQWNN